MSFPRGDPISDFQFPISKSYPNVIVDREALRQKLSGGTISSKMRGVYDLLLNRDEQAKYSGKGKGKFKPVPEEIFGAMADFFTNKMKANATVQLVEIINAKGPGEI